MQFSLTIQTTFLSYPFSTSRDYPRLSWAVGTGKRQYFRAAALLKTITRPRHSML